MPQPPSPLDTVDRCLAAVQRLVDGVRPDRWTAATPCTDWDVRQLVNHMVTGNLLFAAIARGQPPPDRSADHLGDDPAGAFHSAGAALLDAFSQPGVLERTFPSPVGEQPGAGLLRMRVIELLTHGWDLARATGQPADLPEDLAEEALEGVRRSLAGRPRDAGPFGPEQPAPPDAPAADRLAAFLGRPL